MTRRARVASINDAVDQETLAVPVTFREGEAVVSPAIPPDVTGIKVPRSFSKEWCERQGLEDAPGSVVVLRSWDGPNLALVSLGANDQVTDHYRLGGAGVARAAGDSSIAFLLPATDLKDPRGAAQALVEGALLASYRFKDRDVERAFDVVPLGTPLPSVATHDDVTRGVERGAVVAEAVNWVKYLADSPADAMAPRELANEIDHRLSRDEHVQIEVWTESKIREERLGGLLGVGRGSAQPSRLVYATYDPAPGQALPHVALVGKGITFDSGGLSIKPREGMMAMKTDMTGAAVVMAALSLASRLALSVRVTAIAPLAENLLGDNATKPGDVLTIRNGMTIEVLNTDAEGRLVLADGLSLAAEATPDAIIDVATLTAAQSVALGDEVGALFATDDALAHEILAASERSGEPFWRLPLVDSYDADIASDVADMKNMGKPPKAGSIVAALLLRRFTDGRPWAHLDIAGPSRSDSAHGFVTKGATAFSTRTLIEYLEAVAVPSS